ncbi:hypothetical protein ACHAW6_004215 [Cyclotella cf. meneghiniana]
MNHDKESISLTRDGSQQQDVDTPNHRLVTFINNLKGNNDLHSSSRRLHHNRVDDFRGSQQYQYYYATLPNDLSDSWEETSYNYKDHGEVASENVSDPHCIGGESDSSDDDVYQAGEILCYWTRREVGWNDPQNTKEDSRENNISRERENGNSRGWFRRRNDKSEQEEGRWSFRGRSQQHHESTCDDNGSPNTQDREEIVLYCVPDYHSDQEADELDPNTCDDLSEESLLSTSSHGCGHAMPAQNSASLIRSQSPLRIKWPNPVVETSNSNNCNKNGSSFSNMPILRPFMMGSRRGYTDQPKSFELDAVDSNIDCDALSDYAIDVPLKQDRDAVVQSISEGIVGVCDDSLVLDLPSTTNNVPQIISRHHHENDPLRFLRPLARLIRGRHHQRSNDSAIKNFHALLRKEDWSLATTVLRSNLGPSLAQTWHPVQRLYGGRYDGDVLPLHAACALRPPASFIENLAAIHPEALLAKEKSFGRVPLHVACRSLAHSSVIRVLCEMEPRCVEERDSLKRVALHYLVKNYTTLGEDSEKRQDSEIEYLSSVEERSQHEDNCAVRKSLEEGEQHPNTDGIVALKILLETNPRCVHATDHRGWIPLHVACSSSSRKGMTNVLKLLLETWPESVLRKTSKGSDVFDCVNLAGEFHPTRDLVLSILKEAKQRVQDDISSAMICENDQALSELIGSESDQKHDNNESDKGSSRLDT